MSQENVAVVRRAYEAWNAGDHAAFFEMLDPEVELILPDGGVNTGVRQGSDAAREFFRSYAESFENWRVEPEQYFAAGDEVVAFVRLSGRGRESGVEIEDQQAHVLRLREGNVLSMQFFPDRAAALEAVGLRE